MAAATKLRHIIENPQSFLLCPGVYDGLSARVALSVGFDGLYMTGAGSAASVLGHAELGLMTQTHMRASAEMIAELGSLPEQTGGPIPLIADGDTGYGGPIMVARTVQQYARSGVAGLHIEDQVQMKRCGHLAGKEVVEQDIYFSRIRAAVNARKQINSDIIIIARTDALQTHGYDEAIRRLKGACKAGADVAFLEGLTSKAQASRLIKDLFPVPVLLNILEAGSTPSFSADEAREIGFKIMISPFLSIIPAYEAMKTTLQHFKDTGSMNDESKKVTPQDLFRICGLDSTIKIDRESGGRSFLNGVD